MNHIIQSEWKGGLAFESNIDGHKIRTDAPTEAGGEDSAPSPKKLMLTALAGCTGIDVVSILKKMRVEVEKCNITVEGKLREEHPKYYEKIHLIYQFSGKNLPMDKLAKAVKMSEETYCGVMGLYKQGAEITSEIRIV